MIQYVYKSGRIALGALLIFAPFGSFNSASANGRGIDPRATDAAPIAIPKVEFPAIEEAKGIVKNLISSKHCSGATTDAQKQLEKQCLDLVAYMKDLVAQTDAAARAANKEVAELLKQEALDAKAKELAGAEEPNIVHIRNARLANLTAAMEKLDKLADDLGTNRKFLQAAPKVARPPDQTNIRQRIKAVENYRRVYPKIASLYNPDKDTDMNTLFGRTLNLIGTATGRALNLRSSIVMIHRQETSYLALLTRGNASPVLAQNGPRNGADNGPGNGGVQTPKVDGPVKTPKNEGAEGDIGKGLAIVGAAGIAALAISQMKGKNGDGTAGTAEPGEEEGAEGATVETSPERISQLQAIIEEGLNQEQADYIAAQLDEVDAQMQLQGDDIDGLTRLSQEYTDAFDLVIAQLEAEGRTEDLAKVQAAFGQVNNRISEQIAHVEMGITDKIPFAGATN